MNIAVVYLDRFKNGPMPWVTFKSSYDQNPAGVDHTLIPIRKGVGGHVSDMGYDLGAYRFAARRLEDYTHFLFLNSFSEILCPYWLLRFAQAFTPGVGIVGATASQETFRNESKPPLRRTIGNLFFGPYPNPHIRTTGFMIRRDVMLEIWPSCFLSKYSCYIFESGKNGLTRRIEKLGLLPLVVGRNGQTYTMRELDYANVFRQGMQENLIISDNKTKSWNTTSDTDTLCRQYRQ
jgi:hypothetical protein